MDHPTTHSLLSTPRMTCTHREGRTPATACGTGERTPQGEGVGVWGVEEGEAVAGEPGVRIGGNLEGVSDTRI